MGCASSKIDDLPAILLCRDRLNHLSQALHHRFLLSQAHLSYTHSLQSLALSLHRFLNSAASSPPPQPPSTSHRKIVSNSNGNDKNSGHLSSSSHSHSGSHLHLSDSSSDDDDVHFLHDHDHGSGSDSGSGHFHHMNNQLEGRKFDGGGMMMYEENGFGGGSGFGSGMGLNPYLYSSNNNNGYNINYMKKHVTPSVSYEQRPINYETQTVQFGDLSKNYTNTYDYFGGNHNNNYNNNDGYMGNFGGAGYFGLPVEAQRGGVDGWKNGLPQPQMRPIKQQEAPPPPPPPPVASEWDFMNVFESIEESNYSYPVYRKRASSSRNSWEVREEEGIPELENEVVKKVHGHQKLAVNHGGGEMKSGGEAKGEEGVEEEMVRVSEVESVSVNDVYKGRPSGSIESAPVEYEVRVVDKKVVGDDGGKPGFRDCFEVVKEIQVQFERAANCGVEIGNVLEVGKLRYQRKNAALQVSAKMLNLITPSLPLTSRDEASLDLYEDVQLRSKNLSGTLQKLYLWEKKLLEEVKFEEEMRVKHDRKSVKLNRMVEKGAEPHKIETTRTDVRSLSTKIRTAIQIVDKISAKINKLRDEELWPQLNELIQGLSRMWKGMLECHHSQCEAIDGARGLDALAFPNNPSDTHLEASLQLEHDLLNWTCLFTEWIGAQKEYVRALNSWLMKCILYEPEETADGIAPFSPGRAGAPPVFVICNQWNQSLERISKTSEKDLIDSIRVFSMTVLHFRERDKGELRKRMTANQDMERKVKNMEKEDIKMQKKMVLAPGDSDGLSLSGHVVHQSDTSSKFSLQAGLRHVFEALDKFTADSVKAYEELLTRSEEVVREHGKVSS